MYPRGESGIPSKGSGERQQAGLGNSNEVAVIEPTFSTIARWTLGNALIKLEIRLNGAGG